VEKVEEFFNCESCKTAHPLEKAIRCELCNINDASASETEEEDNDEDPSANEIVAEDDASVDTWDGKIKHLFCKKCTRKCDACEERGCKECVEFACCDCDYNMCYQCRNNEVDCGCYGECYSCGVDIDRGSDGWPCGECEKWYCRGCRDCDNPCKECGPESESESESEDKLEPNKIRNLHMEVADRGNYDFKYLYTLRPGISAIKGGIKVLYDLQYPASIVETTRRILSAI
jgi:hypothetical protein